MAFKFRDLFGKPDKPSPPNRLPKELHFKGTAEAFDYACKFMKTNIAEKNALTALIVDWNGQLDPIQSLIEDFNDKIDENVFISYRTRVSSKDGGFDAPAICYNKSAILEPGDLVYWVPMDRNELIELMAKDKRSAWIGGIVAKLEPTLSLRDGFRIKEQYA